MRFSEEKPGLKKPALELCSEGGSRAMSMRLYRQHKGRHELPRQRVRGHKHLKNRWPLKGAISEVSEEQRESQ